MFRERTDAEIIAHLEVELKKHDPDIREIIIDGKEFSRREMIEEARKGTPIGKEILANHRELMKLMGQRAEQN